MGEEGPALLLHVEPWEVYEDVETKKPYFYNTSTETTQWETPDELQENAEVTALMAEHDVGEEEGELPNEEEPQQVEDGVADVEKGEEAQAEWQEGDEEWAEAKDEETGQVYFYNLRDGRTQWDMPEELKAKQQPEAEAAADQSQTTAKENLESGELEEGELEEGELEEEELEAAIIEHPKVPGAGGSSRWGAEQAETGWGAAEPELPAASTRGHGSPPRQSHPTTQSHSRRQHAGAYSSHDNRHSHRDKQQQQQQQQETSQWHSSVSAYASPQKEQHHVRSQERPVPVKPEPGSATHAPHDRSEEGYAKSPIARRQQQQQQQQQDADKQRHDAPRERVVESPEKRVEKRRDRSGESSPADGVASPPLKQQRVLEETLPRSPEGPPPPTLDDVMDVIPTSPTAPPPGGSEQMEVESEREPEPALPAWMQQSQSQLEEAERRLRSDDSIMDPGVYSVCEVYMKEIHRLSQAGVVAERTNVEELLATSYRGYANMAVLVAGWLQNLSGDGTEADLDAKELILDHLRGQVKANFDVNKADALLFGQRKDMLFIDDMMQHKRWRRVLIEIFSEHKDSKLLGGYCMQHMSRAGHNTEMADIISVTDYWGVARGVLSELLAEVPFADHVSLWRILSNLKRMCCPTGYLHLFAQQTLAALESKLLDAAKTLPQDEQIEEGRPTRAQSVIASARKYRRIRQELEKASWELVGEHDRTRARFVHKLSGWNRPQRRRLSDASHDRDAAMNGDTREDNGWAAGEGMEQEDVHRLVEMVLTVLAERLLSARALEMLTAAYVQTGMFKDDDDDHNENLIFGGFGDMGLDSDDEKEDDSSGGMAQVDGPLELIRHPQVLELLMKAIFDPKRRLGTEDQRRRACKVLAVASSALTDSTIDKAEAQALYRALVKASKLLADEETLRWSLATSSIPSTLKELLRHPPAAMGFLHWLRVTIQDPDFNTSRQFYDVMQVFLRLLQFLVSDSPLHQPAVFAALKALISLRSNYNALNITKMKRQALQCCVHLMSQGFVLPVLDFIRAGVRDMDHALIRQFVGMTLMVAQPPYSQLFASSMSAFLREPVVSKALKSNMEDRFKRALAAFVEEVCQEDSSVVEPAMKKGLLLVYSHLVHVTKPQESHLRPM